MYFDTLTFAGLASVVGVLVVMLQTRCATLRSCA